MAGTLRTAGRRPRALALGGDARFGTGGAGVGAAATNLGRDAGGPARRGRRLERTAVGESFPGADRAGPQGGGPGAAPGTGPAAARRGTLTGGDGGGLRVLRPGPPQRRVPGDDGVHTAGVHGGPRSSAASTARSAGGRSDGRGGDQPGALPRPERSK